MNAPLFQTFRLVPRGRPGLACDDEGVALGPVGLVEAFRDEDGALRFRSRPAREVSETLKLAYGDAVGETLARRRRGLEHIAELLTDGEEARAKLHAVLLGFPAIDHEGMAKLRRLAEARSGELRKRFLEHGDGVVTMREANARRSGLQQNRRSLMRDRFRCRDSDPRQSLLRDCTS